MSLSQVLDLITIGLVESVKMVESKRWAFISFLEETLPVPFPNNPGRRHPKSLDRVSRLDGETRRQSKNP